MKKDQRLISLLQSLIKIDSQKPGSDESAVAKYVCSFLRRFKYNPRVLEFYPKRSNVLLKIKSKNSRRSLLISPHLDTVPAGGGWRIKPFSGRIINNKVYGRGASDCKGNLAAALEALARIKEKKDILNNTDIIFAATADEEAGSKAGFMPLLKKILPLDYALVLDGSNFEITHAQKGLLHLRIEFRGVKAHGAYLERGKNAVVYALDTFKDIEQWVKRSSRKIQGFNFTVNLGKIEGGERVNIVPDRCFMELDFRFALEKDLNFFLKAIRRLSKKRGRKASLKVLTFQKPAKTDINNALIKTLKQSLKDNRISPLMRVCKGATVLNFLTAKKIPCAVFGFSSKRQAHAADEYITTKNLTKGASVLYDFLVRFDNTGS